MARGKQTCKILKEIRRQIAEANDIEFITSECQYQGDCLGTCPKCEAEVRYLEQQLERKRRVGKAITLFGLSTGILTIIPPTSLDAETLQCPKMNWTITVDSLIQEKDMKGGSSLLWSGEATGISRRNRKIYRISERKSSLFRNR